MIDVRNDAEISNETGIHELVVDSSLPHSAETAKQSGPRRVRSRCGREIAPDVCYLECTAMPELPEVETVVRGLREVLPGRQVMQVRLGGKTDFIDDPAAIERDLPGKRFAAVRRFGKFILLDLAHGANQAAAREAGPDPAPRSLLVHLGMTGRLRVFPAAMPIDPHTHVFFTLDDGRELRYTDIRRFGRMGIVATDHRQSDLGELGVDPIEATEKEFGDALRNRRARIKSLLLDQTALRGIGNIYADESLWRARIHPLRLASSLSDKELRALYRATQHILNEAIRLKGSSVSNYVDSEGQPGKMQQRHRAYQRDGEKCSRCGTLIGRIVVAGRSTHFCPHCQRAPRVPRRSAEKKTAAARAPRRSQRKSSRR
jgi:formamidopyrimidine-DNA glycosylase